MQKVRFPSRLDLSLMLRGLAAECGRVVARSRIT